MDWLAHKYIGILSTRLDRFKRRGSSLYNFRCPFCMDSQTSKTKARGYVYEKQGKLLFYCQNCSMSMGIPKFIKSLDQNLYDEYVLEKFKDNKTEQQVDLENFVSKMKKPNFIKFGPLRTLKKVSQLEVNHPVKKLVESRKIPNEYHAKLFSCPNFKTFTNELVPGKFTQESLTRDETRLLIPFLDKDKNLIGYQGRALGESKVKYITIILDETQPKVFGLDTVDLYRKPVYVLEGPIDSMFIKNSIATLGGDLVSAIKTFDKDRLVIVYDNEPRSHETIKKIDKAILNGYNVCIWPENYTHKDVNDAVLAGLSSEFIEHIIKTNTYKDLAANLALMKWRKI